MSDKDHTTAAVIEKTAINHESHPLALVHQAVANGMDPDTIGKLMNLAERHEANEARKAYTRALTEMKRDLPTVIARDKTVNYSSKGGRVNYTHTSLAAVMDAITEPLARHGFSLSWSPATEQREVKVTCVLTHALGHSESTTLSAPVDTSGSKSPAQGLASTITLLSRYSALALLGIATADHLEPAGETPPDHIDSSRNIKAVAAMVKAGVSKVEAEAFAGKPVSEWTDEDLGKLRAWFKQRTAPKEEPTPDAYADVGPGAWDETKPVDD